MPSQQRDHFRVAFDAYRAIRRAIPKTVREWVWAELSYACESCSNRRSVLLCLGVEGPASMAHDPLSAPQEIACDVCSSAMRRVGELVAVDLGPVVAQHPFARVPSRTAARRLASSYAGGPVFAQLIEPVDEIVAAAAPDKAPDA